MLEKTEKHLGKILIIREDDDDIYFTVYCGILLLLYILFPSFLDHAIRSISPLLKDLFEI
jgi:hypothetical protein